ncbi:MAG: hypothetical protein GY746_06155, partial [Gammaproteobacteria bacterium]|nr:hypothetical protein [Gammaproteobacteria bacterium]
MVDFRGARECVRTIGSAAQDFQKSTPNPTFFARRLTAIAGVVAISALLIGWPGSVDAATTDATPAVTDTTPAANPAQFGLEATKSGSDGQPEAKDSSPAANEPGDKTPDQRAPVDLAKDKGDKGKPKDKDGAGEEQVVEPLSAQTSSSTVEEGGTQVVAPSASSLEYKSVNGSFVYSYKLDVPEFRGLEPSLVLNYSSLRKRKTGGTYQGWLGYGWGLGGFDVIQRASKGKGAPYYNANDIFLLNGSELVPCDAGVVSPSCSSGGTHATENESYQRITRDAPNNTWTVTNRVGTKSLFKPVADFMTTPPTVDPDLKEATDYRWLLARVTNMNGQFVEYDYDCVDAPVCLPKTIKTVSHDQASSTDTTHTTIEFFTETRPDPITHATGVAIATIDKRIRTVKVSVGTQTRSAYKITYEQSSFSGATLLKEIKQYGNDVVVDAAGVITAGSFLPPTMLTYSDTYGTVTAGPTIATSVSQSGGKSPDKPIIVDMNSDGKAEFYVPGVSPYTKQKQGKDGPIYTNYPGVSGFFAEFDGGTYQKTDLSAILNGQDFEHNCRSIWGDVKKRILKHGTTRKRYAKTVCDKLSPWPESDQFLLFGHFDPDYTASLLISPDFYLSLDTNDQFEVSLCEDKTNCTHYYKKEYISSSLPKPSVYDPDYPIPHHYSIVDSNHDGIDEVGEGTPVGGVNTPPYYDYPVGAVDMNGDGKNSFLFQSDLRDPNPFYIFQDYPKDQNFPDLTVNMPTNCYSYSNGCEFYFADVNGDGATDIVATRSVSTSSEQVSVYLSYGSGYTARIVSSLRRDIGGLFADVDGDGAAEAIVSQENGPTHTHIVSLATGAPVILATLAAQGNSSLEGSGDLDGDGQDDLINRWSSSQGREGITPYYTNGSVAGLLSTVENGYGGKVTVEYQPSSNWNNDHMPIVIQTVSKLSVEDGRGWLADTSYTYEGGKYDRASRKFLGFRKIIETKPCIVGETSCPSVERTYRQDLASYGKLEQEILKDGAGTILTQRDETWTINATTRPYTALNTQSLQTSHETGGSISTRQNRDFDSYGNVDSIVNHGLDSVTGDESWTYRGFAPNTSDYIVSLPYYETIRDGSDGSPPMIRKTFYDYDNQSQSHNTPPVEGNLTHIWRRTKITGSQQYVRNKFEYDDFGNQIRSTDPLSHRTEIEYDSTYNLYPIAERNPLYFEGDTRQHTSTAWNYVCGAPASIIDLNTQTTTQTYDLFCRKATMTRLSDGYFESHSYLDEGNPNTQRIAKWTPVAGHGAGQFYYIYFDGLGRAVSQISPNHYSGGPSVFQYTTYNKRGNIYNKTLPYFYGETAQYVTYGYDARDRNTLVTNPDSSTRSISFSTPAILGDDIDIPVLTTTTTDELGRSVDVSTDVDGNVVRITRHNSSSDIHEYRHYDQLNRLVGVKDHGLNEWAYTYDMIDNRLTASDPDLGDWAYEYDKDSRLIRQTDARGKSIALTYDALERLLTKTDEATSVVTTSNTYDEERTGYFNIGQLTTSTNANGKHEYDYEAAAKLAQK